MASELQRRYWSMLHVAHVTGEQPMLVPVSVGLLREEGLLVEACRLFDLEVAVTPEGSLDCDEAGAVVRSQSFWCSTAGPDGVLLWNDNLMLTREQLALLGLTELIASRRV